MIRLYLNKKLKLEDLYKATEYLTLFDKHKGKLPVDKRDLIKYKSLPDLYDVVKPFEDVKTKKEEEKEIKNKDVIKKFENKDWLVVVPLTHEASCYYGSNTQWCTASRQNKNWFYKYSKQGPLYIIINKKTNEKFQFHLESGSYMDQRDREIDIYSFLHNNKELEIFFEKEKEIRLQEHLSNLRKILELGANEKIYDGLLYIKKDEKDKDLYYIFNSIGPSCADFMMETPNWTQDKDLEDVAISRTIMREIFNNNFNNFEKKVLSLDGSWDDVIYDEESNEKEKEAWLYMMKKLDFFSQMAIEKKYDEFFNEKSIPIIIKTLNDLNIQLKNIKTIDINSLFKLIYEKSPSLMDLIQSTIKETLKPTFFENLRYFLIANLNTLFEIDIDNMMYGLVINLKNNNITVSAGDNSYYEQYDYDYFSAEFKIIKRVNNVLESGDVDEYIYNDDYDLQPIEFTFSLDDAISNTTSTKFIKNLLKNIREFVMDERQEKIKFERKIYFKKFIKENDFSVFDKKFYGNFGAGVLPYCSKTKKFLLGRRSEYVNEPNTWNVFGGAIEVDEKNAAFAAVREFKEETGYSGHIKIKPLYVYQEEGNEFKYFNFLGIISKEFIPNLNWETKEAKWFTLDELLKLKNKHFGLISLLNNKYQVLKELSEK